MRLPMVRTCSRFWPLTTRQVVYRDRTTHRRAFWQVCPVAPVTAGAAVTQFHHYWSGYLPPPTYPTYEGVGGQVARGAGRLLRAVRATPVARLAVFTNAWFALCCDKRRGPFAFLCSSWRLLWT